MLQLADLLVSLAGFVKTAMRIFEWRNLSGMERGQTVVAVAMLGAPFVILTVILFWDVLTSLASSMANSLLASAAYN